MEAATFNTYTEHLLDALSATPEVIGFVTLGTTAEPGFRDQWSDHDFWVITQSGKQEPLLNDLSWLPDAHEIVLKVRHHKGWVVIYGNRHKVEFAVMDVKEALEGKVQSYRILIDRDQIAELMESVQLHTLKQAQVRTDALENLCVLLWSACERYSRGELLSAHQYLHGFAVNQLLSWLSEIDDEVLGKDVLDPRRRLERRSAGVAEALLAALRKTIPIAALHLLEIAEREIKSNRPALAWDKVTMVKGWIRDLATHV